MSTRPNVALKTPWAGQVIFFSSGFIIIIIILCHEGLRGWELLIV